MATKQASATATAFSSATARAFTYAKLGALAFAAVSVKAAIDFNRAFTQIAAITNTSADRIEGLKSTVMALSHETAVAPNELAHAMYFLASAGLDVTQQMSALDAVAHGVAIGLGDAGDLARIEANALNAFADQGLTATQVMDALTAAIKAGTAEPDEFSQALGRVMPVADQAGISFNSVVASLAAMSNAGLDVQEGVTSLRAMLQSLVAPTVQTENAFAAMGLTVTDVTASMQGNGLIATLRMVAQRAKGATESTGEFNQLMRHAIPNIRGLVGALNLTHQEAAKVDEVFRLVASSAGATAAAFKTTAESDAFKLKQALNDIQIAGQELATAVLPVIATALGFVAKNAKLLLGVLLTYGTLRFIAPMIRGMAVANTELATAETAAGTAAIAEAEAIKAAQMIMRMPAPPMPGGVPGGMPGQMPLPFPAPGQQQLFNPASLTPARVDLEAFGPAATKTLAPIEALGAASNSTSSAIGRFGNSIGESGVPQIFALIQALQDGEAAFRAFQDGGTRAAAQSVVNSKTFDLVGSIPGSIFGGPAGSIVKSIFSGPSTDEIQHMVDGINSVLLTLKTAGISAKKQAEIINTAVTSIGGTVNTDNVDAYTTAVQEQLDVLAQHKAEVEADKAAALELTKQHQAAAEATDAWQNSTAKMTAQLSGLNRIGIDVDQFMSKLETDLANSDDQAQTFRDAIASVSQAWMDFQSQAAESLNFAPQALADLTSAAQGAQDQLDSMTKTSSITGNELADLRNTANLTGEDILQSFQDAADQTKSFGHDLMEISRVGGDAGKALAASLLESGNVLAAQRIADEPGKLQGQIVHAFGESADMADKLATKLTNAIVGPLNDIVSILRKLATQAFNIDLGLHDKAKKGLGDRQRDVDKLTRDQVINMILKDNASHGLTALNSEVTGLVGVGPHEILMSLNAEAAKQRLRDFDSALNSFIAQKREVVIGVHTEGHSPMPDEALRLHFVDPIKKMGFRKIGDAWTVPLDVAAHTDANAPDGSLARRSGNQGIVSTLRAIQHEQHKIFEVQKSSRGLLSDIKGLLKSGSGTGGGTTGGTGGGGGGAGGGGGHDDRAQAITGPLVGMLKDFKLYVSSVEGSKAASKWTAQITKAIQSGEGKPVHLIQQAMRDMAKVTNADEAHKATDEFRLAIAHWEDTLTKHSGVMDKLLDPKKGPQITGPLSGMIRDFSKYVSAVQGTHYAQKWAKEMAKQADWKGTSHMQTLLIKQAMRDMAKVTNAKEAHKATDEFRRAIAHWEDTLKNRNPLAVRRSEREWADLAMKNVPRLPAGHTNISTNPHNRRHRQQIRIDRKHMDDQAAYQTSYSGFAS